MLVLTRKEGETVVIAPGTAHECRVKVERHNADSPKHVRLSFAADRDVVIIRSELLERGLRP